MIPPLHEVSGGSYEWFHPAGVARWASPGGKAARAVSVLARAGAPRSLPMKRSPEEEPSDSSYALRRDTIETSRVLYVCVLMMYTFAMFVHPLLLRMIVSTAYL